MENEKQMSTNTSNDESNAVYKQRMNDLFLSLFEKAETMNLASQGCVSHSNDCISSINTSDITTKCIQEAGRWCERYASDIIISWDEVREHIEEHIKSSKMFETNIIVLGFRKSGVDGNNGVYNQMHSHLNGSISDYYSKIYAIKIEDEIDTYGYKNVSVEMRNIESNVSQQCYKWRMSK